MRIVVIAACLVSFASPAWVTVPHAREVEPPPPMEWISVHGDTLSWDDLREGRPLVMVFWATWCAVCKKEWPKLQALADDYADAPLPPAWAAVSLGEKPSRVATEARKRRLPGTIIADPQEKNGKALGVEFVPTIFLLDSSGRLAYRGHPKIDELDRRLKELTSPTQDEEASP